MKRERLTQRFTTKTGNVLEVVKSADGKMKIKGGPGKLKGRRLPDGTLMPARAKGTLNRTTRVLKEAILLAAEQVGWDGKGKDGLTGYLRKIAMTDTKSFCALLAKVLPLQISGPNGGPVRVISENMSTAEAAALYAETIRAFKRGDPLNVSPVIEGEVIGGDDNGTRH